MTNRPRSPQPGEPQKRPLTKRQLAAMQQEANQRQRLILSLAGAVSLALVLIVAGLAYDRLYVPSRSVRSVNGKTLTRADYEKVTRDTTLQDMIRTLEFSKVLGPDQSFGQQSGTFKSKIVEDNSKLATLGTAKSIKDPVNDQDVTTWTDQTIAAQKAKKDFGIDPQIGEIDQAILAQYGSLLTPPPSITATTTVSQTGVASTAQAGTTATVAQTRGTSNAATTALPTATLGPTATPSTTPTPSATPVADVATKQVSQVVDLLYTEYENILKALPADTPSESKRTNATKNDFLQALHDQFHAELTTQRVKEKLPLDAAAGEPTQITVRHILLKVPQPTTTPSPTPTRPAPQASTTVTPTATIAPSPTPTLPPAQLDAAYQARLPEAETIYTDVSAHPDTFAQVARAKSEDETTKDKGGELPPFGRQGQMVKPFTDAAFALKDNEISKPIRTEFGWHIIQRLPEDPQAKKDRLQTAAYDKWLAEARASATIVPPSTPTPTPPAASTSATAGPSSVAPAAASEITTAQPSSVAPAAASEITTAQP